MVNSFKETMPIVTALSSDFLMERHWNEIKKILKNPEIELEKKEYTLGTLIKMEVDKYADQIIM
jgi:hypothetical protein